MVESDDEFTELCSKLLKRVKKNKPSGQLDIQKTSTAAKSKLKRSKPPNKKLVSNEAAKEAGAPATRVLGKAPKQSDQCNSARDTDTKTHHNEVSNCLSQKGGDEITEPVRSQELIRTKDLVLERMKQFKRTSPIRMKANNTEQLPFACLPSGSEHIQSDCALAAALQMELVEQQRSLEDEGLFFCQICQKDLSSMNTVMRAQHVNRCLDQSESLVVEPGPSIPSCPLCGKPFNTKTSRASHLKCCAAKLEIPAHTLLQAVQRQATESSTDTITHAALAQSKRKATSKQKEPPKKKKMVQPSSEVEELLVAMALSRSLQEDPRGDKVNRVPLATNNGVPAKKRRKKQKNIPAPLLLVQAPEAALQRLQQRVSLLMRYRKKRAWYRSLPEENMCILWESSKMLANSDPHSYYTLELNPLVTPWNPPQKKLLNSQKHTVPSTLPTENSLSTASIDKKASVEECGEEEISKSCSQNDTEALLDLAELAGEGLTLTQWKLVNRDALDRTDQESVESFIPSGFVPSQHKVVMEQTKAPCLTAPLVSLAADFLEMVNNPVLSDAQLQTDCGEVINVHMFVLYARCPLLVEAVHSEGFWVDEKSTGHTRRLLLNDISADATLCFLRFLYSGCSTISAHCLVHVCELARRFGVSSLIDICEHLVSEPEHITPQDAAEVKSNDTEDDDGGMRAETFQELLKSMWLDEDEEGVAILEAEGQGEDKMEGDDMGESELEEIYEFAATQRRVTEEQSTNSNGADIQHQKMESEDEAVYEVTNEPVRTEASITNTDIPFDKDTPPKCSSLDSSPLTAPLKTLEQSSPVNTSPDLSAHKTHVSPLDSQSHMKLSPVHLSVMTSPGPTACNLLTDSAALRHSSFASVEEQNSAPSHNDFNSGSRVKESEQESIIDLSSPCMDDSYDRMFSETCEEYVEPSNVSNPGSDTVIPTQNQELTSTPNITRFPTLPELGSSPLSFAPCIESPCVAAKPTCFPVSSFTSSKNSPGSELSQNPMHQSTSSHIATSQEPGVILILSSDEETEPNVQASLPPCNEQEICMPAGIKESPASFRGKRSSEGCSYMEMSSSTQNSWLVPATPLPHTAVTLASLRQTSLQHEGTQTSTILCRAASHYSFFSPPLLSPKSPVLASLLSPDTKFTQGFAHPPQECDSSKALLPLTSPPTTPASSSVFTVGDSEDEDLKPDHPLSTVGTSEVCQSQSACNSSPQSNTALSQKSPDKLLILQPSPTSKLTQGTTPIQLDFKDPFSPSSLRASPTSSSVLEVELSEDERSQPEAQISISDRSFQIDYEPPIPMEEELWFNGEETPKRCRLSPKACTPISMKGTPKRASLIQNNNSTPLRGSPPMVASEISSHTLGLQGNQMSFLNTHTWDEWEENDEELPAVLPLSQRLSKAPDKQKPLKTPVSIVRKRELAPKVPITPLPAYSDMDTPVLKKELNRFGVRALPKKKMVLKLKEIFRYTHQTMSSDSDDEVPSSQANRGNRSETVQIPVVNNKKHLIGTKDPSRFQPLQQKKPSSVCNIKSTALEGKSQNDQPLTASQESTTSSSGASDTSSLSQSSAANEFETAFADEEEDETVTASQQVGREVATAEAVKKFIENRPDLYKRILLYQPLELAALQAELKQGGIKVSSGKLLDFLDAHCVTFTTAAARKEKNSRKRRKAGKRY
ncbi:hypothetical protein GDO86_017495 [Hymenochirus boettgeri]|uniref:Structure-specific endonuclease subunit SLX4 n=2 Tax=Hymenochirus TaxID=8361 RepID=A0A8T2IJW5_9PIPI|nr:hypothetical protein GDO86_017495 [Hymenochirus boettgeri]